MEAIGIRRIVATDSELIRRVRLASLRSDPLSFASTLSEESAYTDEQWQDWATDDADGDEMATMLALKGDDPVGVVAAYRDESVPLLYHVIAMWVDPSHRGRGLGHDLLAKIEEWIVQSGGTRVQLDVADTATAAVSLYESTGYVPDGNRKPSPHQPEITHVSLSKSI